MNDFVWGHKEFLGSAILVESNFGRIRGNVVIGAACIRSEEFEKAMARYCKICGVDKANERFGGRSWRRLNCSSCRRLPAEVRQELMLTNEILGFLEQSNISKKNIKRLAFIERTASGRVVRWAGLLRSIALVRPYRRKRWRYVYAQRPDLVQAARLFGFIHGYPVSPRNYDYDSDWEASDWDDFICGDEGETGCEVGLSFVEYVNEQFDSAAMADAKTLKSFTESFSLTSLPAEHPLPTW